MGRAERLALYVALTALTAFAIDGVLPAMPMIDAVFAPVVPFSSAQIITSFILGMAIGELVIGPLCDAMGRRPAVMTGLFVFVIGTIVAAVADTFLAILVGRFLQGVGVAGPKIGTRAMIRDRYAGADMAKIMSIIFTLLILVPMVAPAIGAFIAALGGWRGLFWAYLVLALVLGVWLWLRHPETHPIEKRISLKPRKFAGYVRVVISNVEVMSVVIATGFVFGAQLVYLSVAADLFGELYGLPVLMPAFFALLATGTGLALLLNVRLVDRTGMEAPIMVGILLLGLSGSGLLISATLFNGQPPLWEMIGLAWFAFFGLGLLFGNLNALAMRPLGDLAGLGSSIIASVSSLVAFAFASIIESFMMGAVWSIAWGFTLAALISIVLILVALPNGTIRQLLRKTDLYR